MAGDSTSRRLRAGASGRCWTCPPWMGDPRFAIAGHFPACRPVLGRNPRVTGGCQEFDMSCNAVAGILIGCAALTLGACTTGSGPVAEEPLAGPLASVSGHEL